MLNLISKESKSCILVLKINRISNSAKILSEKMICLKVKCNPNLLVFSHPIICMKPSPTILQHQEEIQTIFKYINTKEMELKVSSIMRTYLNNSRSDSNVHA